MISQNLLARLHGTDPKHARQTRLVATLLVAFLHLFSAAAIAQDDAQPAQEPETLQINVVDEDGEPIKDATIILRTAYHQRQPPLQSSYLVLNKPALLTSGKGQSTLDVPLSYDDSQVTKLNLDVSHSNFVEQNTDVDINPSGVTIVLERGCQISASGINPATGEPITENVYALTNLGPKPDWECRETATLRSPLVGKAVTSFRREKETAAIPRS